MLNDVLLLLDKEGIFGSLGKTRTQELVLRVISISDKYDCNYGEILDGIAGVVGICQRCAKPKSDIRGGVCTDCWREDEKYLGPMPAAEVDESE